MKSLLSTLIVALFLWESAHADEPWQPPAGHVQVPIWPSAPPNLLPTKEPEAALVKGHQASGKPWVRVENVSTPTMTLFLPPAGANGAAVIVFPGGGYRGVAIDLEGTEVCEALTAHGIACVVLKYRVPFSGPHNMNSVGATCTRKSPQLFRMRSARLG